MACRHGLFANVVPRSENIHIITQQLAHQEIKADGYNHLTNHIRYKMPDHTRKKREVLYFGSAKTKYKMIEKWITNRGYHQNNDFCC